MQIITGKIPRAQKVVVYGPEGIGKSTFASKFPNPIFIDTEGSTNHMDVARTQKPTSWTMLLDQVRYFKNNPGICETLVIDTADWAEQLCISEICAKSQKGGIEDFGYGKGYVYLAEEFGRLLNALEDVIEAGIHVVVTAHAQMRKFEQPDEMGAYDRWELKLQKKTAPLVMEWADMVLFANYKTYVVNVDNQGALKGKNKVQGGKRVMYATHHPCWDAKNRHNLKDELPMDFSEIAHCFALGRSMAPSPVKETKKPEAPPATAKQTSVVQKVEENDDPQFAEVTGPDPDFPFGDLKSASAPPKSNIPRPLFDLMSNNGVTEAEIQKAVASKGYYPIDTPIENYDPDFVNGVLVAAWEQVFQIIKKFRV